jgi:hypothetical protein
MPNSTRYYQKGATPTTTPSKPSPMKASLQIHCRLVMAAACTAMCFILTACQTTREQQINRAIKKVVAVPFSQRGPLIHQLAKQGELPSDVANGWITEWNQQTLAIAKAEKGQAKLARKSQTSGSSRRSKLTIEQLNHIIGVYDRNIKSLEATIADIESLRPSRREYTAPISSIPRLRSITITPAGGGSFYTSDASVPNSTRYYQKRGNTYYYSE